METAKREEGRRSTEALQEENELREVWVTPYEIDDEVFADDPSDEKENPFVFGERTEPLAVLTGEVRVGQALSSNERAALKDMNLALLSTESSAAAVWLPTRFERATPAP